MSSRLVRVADEVRFFPSYRHHVATSDYVGDVLRTIYEISLENVHIILNGVNEQDFRPNPSAGAAFRAKYASFLLFHEALGIICVLVWTALSCFKTTSIVFGFEHKIDS